MSVQKLRHILPGLIEYLNVLPIGEDVDSTEIMIQPSDENNTGENNKRVMLERVVSEDGVDSLDLTGWGWDPKPFKDDTLLDTLLELVETMEKDLGVPAAVLYVVSNADTVMTITF
uniref:Uncharacterized protein n=1 Tax=Pithovirus LCPAC101 TaxID=2506586 RepID=A0A481Z4I2_9VIRU|nr:MAG: hypothetical protein LCPAC101_01920 [Pithovirus LCPAC101]